jgi:hypothetical protein
MILNAKKCPFLTNKLFQGNKERNLQSLFKHITIGGCYIKITETKCDCLYKIFSTNISF